MATIHQKGPQTSSGNTPKVVFVKGAPDRIMPMCCGQLKTDDPAAVAAATDLAPLDTTYWSQAQEELSSQGLRVLALCK
jgi:magnesium-transporting ATPase (P-type)